VAKSPLNEGMIMVIGATGTLGTFLVDELVEKKFTVFVTGQRLIEGKSRKRLKRGVDFEPFLEQQAFHEDQRRISLVAYDAFADVIVPQKSQWKHRPRDVWIGHSKTGMIIPGVVENVIKPEKIRGGEQNESSNHIWSYGNTWSLYGIAFKKYWF
jgi:hypothetical protein